MAEATAKKRYKAHEDSELSDDQVNELADKLTAERRRIVDGLERRRRLVTEDDDVLADELDISARNAEQASMLRFADKERKLLNEIDHAIEKLDLGDYGICEGTGEPIGYRRLEVRPWTRYSVMFKEQMERWKDR